MDVGQIELWTWFEISEHLLSGLTLALMISVLWLGRPLADNDNNLQDAAAGDPGMERQDNLVSSIFLLDEMYHLNGGKLSMIKARKRVQTTTHVMKWRGF